MTIHEMFVGPERHGVPTSFGAKGALASGERVAVIAYDRPQEWRERSKAGAERMQIERFQADFRMLTGATRYGAIANGADPPDFVCELNGESLGVEITQLVVADRVAASELFRRIRMAALSYHAEAFRHLAGHMIYVSFTQGADYPPSQPDRIKRLVRAISSMRLPEVTLSEATELPVEPSRETHRVDLPGGATATAARLASDPGGMLFARAGIELGLAYSSTTSQLACWEELERLVSKHDKPGVHELVIAAGAPIARGLAFPSDALLVELALEASTTSVLDTQHIRQIFLHDWWSRAIHVLMPHVRGAVPLS
jgi:hypothetical protein